MPEVHIWVRKEDWAQWQAITDKPAWLHSKINEDSKQRYVKLANEVKAIDEREVKLGDNGTGDL